MLASHMNSQLAMGRYGLSDSGTTLRSPRDLGCRIPIVEVPRPSLNVFLM